MKRVNHILLLFVGLFTFFSCETNYSQYKVGEVPVTNDIFYEQYLERINQEIEKSPSNAELYYIKASKLLESKKNNSALRTIEKALDLLKDVSNKKYHLLAARIYTENEQFEKALQQLRQVEKFEETTAQTDALFANVYWRQGDYLKADSTSQSAIKKDPFNAEYYAIRGNVLWSMHDTLAARQSLLKSISLGPASTTYEKLLEVYLAEKNYEYGFQVLNHLINLHPEKLTLQYRKAEIYSNIDEEVKARTIWRSIINQYPESEEAYHNLTDMYLSNLRYDSAIYFQNQLIVRDSTNAEPYLNLARIYDRRFWYTSASDYYQRYLQLNPDNLVAQEELEKVENKVRYINRLQQEKERLSNASKLKTIKKEQPKKIE